MQFAKMNKIKVQNPIKIDKMNKKQVIHLLKHKAIPTLKTWVLENILLKNCKAIIKQFN